MKRILRARRAYAALFPAIAIALAACTTDFAPTAPAAPPPAVPNEPSNLLGLLGGDDSDDGLGGLLQGLLSNLSLHSCDSPDLGSVSKSIGPEGGLLRIGPHSLAVPPGALAQRVTITATAKAGSHVRVDFAPHGLRFNKPALLRLSYAHCSSRPLLPKVVYVDGVGDLLSILKLIPALDDRTNERASAWLRHFSGYAIAD